MLSDECLDFCDVTYCRIWSFIHHLYACQEFISLYGKRIFQNFHHTEEIEAPIDNNFGATVRLCLFITILIFFQKTV